MKLPQILKPIIFLVFTFFFNCPIFAQSPNILLIIADDLGVDAINGYNLGSINPTTPHLDSLRNSGLTFANAWSSSVCTPTRGGMMSGKYGSINGVKTSPGNLDTTHVSLFKMLKNSNSNYSTAVSGKWHISHPIDAQHPILHGADHYTGMLSGGVSSYSNWSKTENGVTTTSTDYVTSYFTDNAINWINTQSNPWFLWLAHVAPHTPFHEPPSTMHSQSTTNTPMGKYMAMIESLDYEVGRLLDSLSSLEKENTTIIFIGDNGTPNIVLQDYPSNHGKKSLYQGGIHVPMFVSGNGVTREGETENALVNVIDIYATVLELTGLSLPGGIYNSLSFSHLLTGYDLPKRRYNFSELDSNIASISTQGFAIRDSTYKLIEYHNGQQEMYNLSIDPLETMNLLLGTLNVQEQNLKLDLQNEALQRISAWSCKDYIQNGDEEDVDCGGSYCSPCEEISTSDCEGIALSLNNGWNMIGFGCVQNSSAVTAFSSIQNEIIIVKDGLGNAYLPEWNFNGIGDLERGYGYLIKVSVEIFDFNICE